MKTWFKLIPGFLFWIPMAAIQVVVILLGLVMVPLALLIHGPNSGDWAQLFFTWGNDGRPPAGWFLSQAEAGVHGKFAQRFPNFWWFAVRNPACNTHWWFADRPANYFGTWPHATMEAPDLLLAKRRKAFRIAWNGIFVGIRWVWLDDDARITYENTPAGEFIGHYGEGWFGFKVGSDTPGMGFAMQLRRHREIGT